MAPFHQILWDPSGSWWPTRCDREPLQTQKRRVTRSHDRSISLRANAPLRGWSTSGRLKAHTPNNLTSCFTLMFFFHHHIFRNKVFILLRKDLLNLSSRTPCEPQRSLLFLWAVCFYLDSRSVCVCVRLWGALLLKRSETHSAAVCSGSHLSFQMGFENSARQTCFHSLICLTRQQAICCKSAAEKIKNSSGVLLIA